ncbi:MAG: PqqD family protein [Oscillospiraceae bacterium]
MKLKDNFITHETDGEQIMVAAGGSFAGMVRSNATAAFIVDCLKNETSKDSIVDAMCAKYDAPREVITKDVDGVLAKLRSIGALNE